MAAGVPAAVRAQGFFDDDATEEDEAPAASDEKKGDQTIEELEDGAAAQDRAEAKKKQDAKKSAQSDEETYAQGSVGTKTYGLYLSSVASGRGAALLLWGILVVLFFAAGASEVSSNAWLRKWASSYDDDRRETSLAATKAPVHIASFVQASSKTLATTSWALEDWWNASAINGREMVGVPTFAQRNDQMIFASRAEYEAQEMDDTSFYLLVSGPLVRFCSPVQC